VDPSPASVACGERGRHRDQPDRYADAAAYLSSLAVGAVGRVAGQQDRAVIIF
jgi:hypothetical protein